MASKLIGIIGDTGTGKSTSIKHLDPKESYIINTARKELPFKGSEKLYNAENKNYKEVDEITEITRLLKTISEKAPHIKNVVIEDSNYMMSFRMAEKATDEKADENVIFVGNKPPMSYVLAVVTQFKSSNEVVIKARGRAISRAVDTAEIVKNRFITDAKIKDIKIDTESVVNEEGNSFNVSSIEIYLTTKKK